LILHQLEEVVSYYFFKYFFSVPFPHSSSGRTITCVLINSVGTQSSEMSFFLHFFSLFLRLHHFYWPIFKFTAFC
jgi:hypothetical protein